MNETHDKMVNQNVKDTASEQTTTQHQKIVPSALNSEFTSVSNVQQTEQTEQTVSSDPEMPVAQTVVRSPTNSNTIECEFRALIYMFIPFSLKK